MRWADDEVLQLDGLAIQAPFGGYELEDGSRVTNLLYIKPTGDGPVSASTGGAGYIDNTLNRGVGFGVYSANAAPGGNLAFFRVNHASFNQRAVRIDHIGTGAALDILHTGNGAALNVVGQSGSVSTFQISGSEESVGTIKISHNGTGTDANAAALSIDLDGAGTAAQGIFIDSTGGGTTGDILDLRDNGTQLLRLLPAGYMLQSVPASSVADSNLWNNSMSMWYNESTENLTIRIKDSTGTTRQATVGPFA